MKVYAIERGQYSDYGIVAMFTTREEAERAVRSMEFKYGDERVVEWTVHDGVPAKVRYFVKERYKGVVSERSHVRDGWDDQMPFLGRVRNGIGIGRWSGNLRVWGKDQAMVRKTFAEQDGQTEAEEAGIA